MTMKRKKPDVVLDRKYSIKEICDMLDICRQTICKYTKLERITPIRITSREIYYLGSEVLVLYDILTNPHFNNVSKTNSK